MVGPPEILNEDFKKLLVFLDMAGEIDGKTKFQKLIFLGKTESNLNISFNFKKYTYGPYSFELSDALDTLENLGLIQTEVEQFESDGPFEGKKITYRLTNKGKEFVKMITLQDKQFENIAKTVLAQWNRQPLRTIIHHVYSKYM